MPLNQDAIYQAIDELRAVSSSGLYYTSNEYDKERYQRVLSIALRLLASLEERSFDEVMREFQEDNWMHRSPAAGAEAVIAQDGKILLIKRSDNHLWAVPGGLVEVGETLAEAAQRELREETWITGQITKLLGVFDSRLWKSKTKAQLYHAIFLAETTDPTPKISNESLEAAFFGEDNLPELAPGHDLRVPMLFKILRGEIPAPYFDLPTDKSNI
jgi:ADP-ribose pyrophosphatase YjhB (NUDIX family)